MQAFKNAKALEKRYRFMLLHPGQCPEWFSARPGSPVKPGRFKNREHPHAISASGQHKMPALNLAGSIAAASTLPQSTLYNLLI